MSTVPVDYRDPPAFTAALTEHIAGRLDAAANAYDALIAGNDPNATDALYFRGIVALQRGDEQNAVTFIKRSFTLPATSPRFFQNLGLVLGGLGRDEGDAVHLFLQRNKLLPVKPTGAMIREFDPSKVEPWYFSRRMISAFPAKQSDFDDEAALVEKFILPGSVPSSPPFGPHSRLLTMGSCFAQELRNYLAENSFRTDLLFVPPGLNNTFALRNFIEWCVTGERSSSAFWYDEHDKGGAAIWMPRDEQEHYLNVLRKIDGLVLTVGLAEVWEDIQSGGIFWRGVPKSMFDDTRHRCRMSSVEENAGNLRAIVDLLRGIRPDLPIVVTLSPIALKASWDSGSCFTADCLSKSVLRVAIGELMADKRDAIYYWPSFEIVRWLGGHVDHAMFGEDGNTRHVNRGTVRLILDGFIKHYFGRSPAD